jgi:hypothetical protein
MSALPSAAVPIFPREVAARSPHSSIGVLESGDEAGHLGRGPRIPREYAYVLANYVLVVFQEGGEPLGNRGIDSGERGHRGAVELVREDLQEALDSARIGRDRR